MKEQDLIRKFLTLNSDIQLFQAREVSEELKLLKASLLATQAALDGVSQRNKSIYRPWLLKCFEFMEYLDLHQAHSDDC